MDRNSTYNQNTDFISSVRDLLASPANLQIILDTIPSAVVLVDTDGNITYVNKRENELYALGYSGFVTGDHLSQIQGQTLSGEVISLVELPVLQSLNGSQAVHSVDMILKATTGDKKYVKVSASPLYCRNETISGTIIIFKDISEQKMMVEELSDCAERYKPLIGSLDAGYSICDVVYDLAGNPADFRFIEINKAYEEHTGLRRDDIIGKTLLEIAPDMEDAWLNILKEVANTGEPQKHNDRNKHTNKYYDTLTFSPLKGKIILILKDITKQIEIKEALRKSEEKFRTLTFASSAMTYYMSPDWRVMRQLSGLGFLANTETEDADWLPNYIPSSDQPIVTKTIAEAIRTKSVFELEHRVFRADGEIGWVHSTAVPFLEPDGEITEWFGAASDITERKLAEENLTFHARLLSGVHDAIISTDENHIITYWNGMAEILFGWSATEAIGERVGDLLKTKVPGSSREAVLALMLEENYYKGEAIYRHKNGSAIYTIVHSSVTRDSDGKARGFISSFRDITQQKKAEDALLDSEAKLRSILEQLPVGVAVFNMNGQASIRNKRMESFMTENIPSRNQQEIKRWSALDDYGHEIPPDQWPGARALRGETVVRGMELNYVDHSGQKHWILVSASPLRSSDGTIIGGISIAKEITGRKQIEDALRKSEQTARTLVADLEEADKNKNEFISVLSHELRNPLAAIVTGLSLMDVTENKELVFKTKEIIKRQTDQLCKLVDDLLDLTRITQNKIQLKKENIQLTTILFNAVNDFKQAYQKKSLGLYTEIPDIPVYLYADFVRINQCISNYLHNALKFTPKGGNVWITLTTEKSDAVIRVRDNGIGISAELLKQLFTPFIQADHSLDRNENDGLGLGLSIVKNIVELHGGTVAASSPGPGKGAVFTMTLPLAEEIRDASQYSFPEDTPQAARILIIEDNRDLSDMLCSILNILGHEAAAAYNGTDGLNRARELKPDIIFCDIGLPGKSGYEVAKAMKNDNELSHVFLIALTGYAAKSDIEQARASGFDRHLAKPVDMAKIQQVLNDFTQHDRR